MKTLYCILVVILILVSFCLGNWSHPGIQVVPVTGVGLKNIRVVDGDTIHADVLLPYGIILESQSIRASDYDTWESRKIRRTIDVTDEEVTKGKAATTAFQNLIDSGTLTLVPSTKPHRDAYGRLLGRFLIDGKSVGEWMKENGHCREGTEDEESDQG